MMYRRHRIVVGTDDGITTLIGHSRSVVGGMRAPPSDVAVAAGELVVQPITGERPTDPAHETREEPAPATATITAAATIVAGRRAPFQDVAFPFLPSARDSPTVLNGSAVRPGP